MHNNKQRQKIDSFNSFNSFNLPNKDLKRKTLLTNLNNKYFSKITQKIQNEINNNKKTAVFYFNYYDFLNERLGHPQLIMKELLYEMSYEYSEYVHKDNHNNIITLKTLFGNNLKFKIIGKNIAIFEWD